MLLDFRIAADDELFQACYMEAILVLRDERNLGDKFRISGLLYVEAITNSVNAYFKQKYPQVEDWPYFDISFDDEPEEGGVAGQFYLWQDEEKDTLFRLQVDL